MSESEDLLRQMEAARDADNETNGRATTLPIASFHKTLKDDGLDPYTAGNITFMYARKILYMETS